MKKTTLTQRVINFLKGGDEAKMDRFSVQVEKYLEQQKRLKLDRIEAYKRDDLINLEEEIADLIEQRKECILAVDLERVKEIGSVKSYIPDYIEKIHNISKAILSRQENIKELNKRVENLEKEISNIAELNTLIFE